MSIKDVRFMPLGAGQWIRPLHFDGDGGGYVAQLKLEPGARIPRHRHAGPVHAFNLEGQRRLDTGELLVAGDYVFEPGGNIDSWEAVGDGPLVVLVVVRGDVEYLSDSGAVRQRVSGRMLAEAYRAHVETGPST